MYPGGDNWRWHHDSLLYVPLNEEETKLNAYLYENVFNVDFTDEEVNQKLRVFLNDENVSETYRSRTAFILVDFLASARQWSCENLTEEQLGSYLSHLPLDEDTLPYLLKNLTLSNVNIKRVLMNSNVKTQVRLDFIKLLPLDKVNEEIFRWFANRPSFMDQNSDFDEIGYGKAYTETVTAKAVEFFELPATWVIKLIVPTY